MGRRVDIGTDILGLIGWQKYELHSLSAAPQQEKKCGRKGGHIVGIGSPSKQWVKGGALDVPRSSRSRTTAKIMLAETPEDYYHKVTVGWRCRGGAATPATLMVTRPKAAFQIPAYVSSALLV